MNITVLHGKIHRATVTQAALDYVGSITVDEDLLDAAGIKEYERVEISDVSVSGNLHSDGDTGGLILTNVLVSGELRLEQNTGDIKLNGCDAGTIFIETDTGDVRGTLLSDKIFLTKTDSGEVDVPRTITGGRCEITTDTGDIKIEVRP